jgi:ferredoxin-NADP reductase
MTESQATVQLLRVLHKQALTPEITRFTLVAADAATPLAAFTPGAHITLHLPNGMARKYSLCNLWGQHAADQGNDDGDGLAKDSAAPCYVIAVKREAAGRGGSCCLVDAVQVGDTVPASLPQNAFALKKASVYLFIAGGIGITPLLSMIRSLAARRMQGETRRPGVCITSPAMPNTPHSPACCAGRCPIRRSAARC